MENIITLPDDILFAIMKYIPKLLSMTNKSLRKRFNPYDNWIIHRKQPDTEKNIISRIYDYFYQVPGVSEIQPEITKIKYLYIDTFSNEHYISYPNVSEVYAGYENIWYVNIHRFPNISKIYYKKSYDYIVGLTNTNSFNRHWHQIPGISITIDTLVISMGSTFNTISAFDITVNVGILRDVQDSGLEELELFLACKNCRILVMGYTPKIYYLFENYDVSKIDKQIVLVRSCLTTDSMFPLPKNIEKNTLISYSNTYNDNH